VASGTVSTFALSGVMSLSISGRQFASRGASGGIDRLKRAARARAARSNGTERFEFVAGATASRPGFSPRLALSAVMMHTVERAYQQVQRSDAFPGFHPQVCCRSGRAAFAAMVGPLGTPNYTRKALPPLPPLSPCSPPAPPRPLQAMAVLMPSFLTTPIYVANHGHVPCR
jgi:hypothetical protein